MAKSKQPPPPKKNLISFLGVLFQLDIDFDIFQLSKMAEPNPPPKKILETVEDGATSLGAYRIRPPDQIFSNLGWFFAVLLERGISSHATDLEPASTSKNSSAN